MVTASTLLRQTTAMPHCQTSDLIRQRTGAAWGQRKSQQMTSRQRPSCQVGAQQYSSQLCRKDPADPHAQRHAICSTRQRAVIRRQHTGAAHGRRERIMTAVWRRAVTTPRVGRKDRNATVLRTLCDSAGHAQHLMLQRAYGRAFP